MMDAMARLSALITVIAADIYTGSGCPDVRMTFGEPEPLNEQLKQPLIHVATDAMDFSWRDSRHEQMNVAYPVYALVYYPREDEDSALEAGDFVERLAAELTAEDRWFGNIPGFIESPSGDYLGFDRSANCHRWVLYFAYRRVPVPPCVRLASRWRVRPSASAPGSSWQPATGNRPSALEVTIPPSGQEPRKRAMLPSHN